jgi:hypothetical protein
MVDKALDWLVDKAVTIGKAALNALGLGDKKEPDERTEEQKQADLDKGITEAKALQNTLKITEASIKKGLMAIKQKYRMTSLELVVDSIEDTKETIHIEGKINPSDSTPPTSIPKKDPEIKVDFAPGRHTIKGLLRANAPNKDNNTILIDDTVDINAVKTAARAAYIVSPQNAGEYQVEDIKWSFSRKGPKDNPAEQYLHIYPMHSPPKAINLSRKENKAVITYQKNRLAGKDHEGALAEVKQLADRLPGAFELSLNALLIIDKIK